MVQIAYYKTVVGILRIEVVAEKIRTIELDANYHGDLPGGNWNECSELVAKQLDEYFDGNRKEFELPLDLQGTEFCKKVWVNLLEIPYGETRSYEDIAIAVGNPKGMRAVGMANHKNPIMIVVPCHRVIGKDGSLAGYAGGLNIKKKLLNIEGVSCE